MAKWTSFIEGFGGALNDVLSNLPVVRSVAEAVTSGYGRVAEEEMLAKIKSSWSALRDFPNFSDEEAAKQTRVLLGSIMNTPVSFIKGAYGGGIKWSTRARRLGTTAALYGAGAVGLRHMSGGSLMYNDMGERDIAGIPFV